MAVNITSEAFINVIRQSQLLDSESIQELLKQFKASGVNINDATALSEALVKSGKLTSWQVEKLLQGKHKGFILGKYRLLSLLGKGGMSSVYLAEHRLMQRRCAIKVLPAKRVNDSSYLGRFHREAQAVASMDHENIVRAYDVDHETEGTTEIHFLVMEYVQGSDLQELILKNGLLNFTSAADYIRQAANGLAHAHRVGMVHRDIKPANLLLDKNGVVKILDMGLARFFEDTDEKSLTVTHDEKVLGTADYLAPEQALDSHHVDSRADIYSLGCTLYFLLTGQPPFNTGTLAQRLLAHQTQEPPDIRHIRQDVPDSLVKILHKMMEKKVENRYQTAEELSNAMVAWLMENGGEEWRSRHPNLQVKQLGGEETKVAVTNEESKLDISSGFDIDVPLKPLDEEDKEKSKSDSSSGRRRKRSRSSIRKSSEVSPSGIEDGNSSESSMISKGGSSKIIREKEVSRGTGSSKIIRSETPLTDLDDNEVEPEVSSDSEMDVVLAEMVDDDEIQEASAVFEDDSDPESPTSSILLKKAAIDDGKFDLILYLTQNRLAQGIVVALFLFLVVSVGILLFTKNNSRNSANGNGFVQENTDEVFKVGKGSDFAFSEINRAINRFNVLRKSKKSFNAVIEVAPGTYPERIQLQDVNEGSLKIVCNPGNAVLFPTGEKPIISLSNCQNVVISGFQVNAQDKPVAVSLSANMTNSKLSNLEISGFNQTGIDCFSIRGELFNTRVQIDNIKFHDVVENTTGIKLTGNQSELSYILIDHVMFAEPMKTGIEIHGDLQMTNIQNNYFFRLQNGIVFQSARPKLQSVVIDNNTFFEIRENAIVYSGMPESGSRANGMKYNLFYGGSEADVVMDEKNWDQKVFVSYFGRFNISGNYTSRNESINSNEIPVIRENFRGTEVKFLSTDPSSNQFLDIDSLSVNGNTVDMNIIKIGVK